MNEKSVNKRLANKIIKLKSGSTVAVFPDASTEHHDLDTNIVTYHTFYSMQDAWKDVTLYQLHEKGYNDIVSRLAAGPQNNSYSPQCAKVVWDCLCDISNLKMSTFSNQGFSSQEVIDTTRLIAQSLFAQGNVKDAAILYYFLAINNDILSQYWLHTVASCGLTELEDRTI